ncbi:hypothetical protein [Leifsonia sp. AG29]|uniref:hypothetical protein n=1 Tax=Leifsonia sp. AG29 TaxID=2598860 RepID=UPI00131AB087|nr:hypothetical protein [Leifsonia sp. AG29]
MKKIGGGSSNLWTDVTLLAIAGVLVALAVMLVCFAIGIQHVAVLFVVALCLEGLCIVGGMAAGGISALQSRRELARGYTSLPSGNANAAQIDPRSGAVIREPGEAFLTKQERVRRTALARAENRSAA